MVTAKTATFEELTKLATDFVTAQKGMWDHAAWVDFVSSVQERGSIFPRKCSRIWVACSKR